jgi:glycogen(starch) synthase
VSPGLRVLSVGNRYPPPAVGGYERIWAAGVAALRRAGHRVRVLTTGEAAAPAGSDDPEVFRELPWNWHDGRWVRRAPIAAEAIGILREHLTSWRPDVVSWWSMGGLSLALLTEPGRHGIPAVGVVGDGWMVYGFDADPEARAADVDLGAAARWLFVSRAVRARVRAEGHRLPRAVVVHPGVDPSSFPFRAAGAWGWRLACIGRVSAEKGVDVAVAALAHLPAHTTLTLDGPGERPVGPGRVRRACTPTDRVAEAYAAADAVLFPVTWPEPWGLVPLEAMSVGRPVVATATGGAAEYLADGRNCLVVPVGDPEAVAGAVRRLAAGPELRERLIAGGRATAARHAQATFDAAVVAAVEDAARGR